MSAVELQHVTKMFGNVVAVDDVSVGIRDGEFFTLLGPSGCGKTTTLRLVAGLYTPTSGDIVSKGRIVTDLPPHKRGIAMVFQNYALFPHMNVYKNIVYGLRIRKVSEAETQKRLKNTLRLVHLEGLENRFPRQLSGGQQQRVALARALIVQPDVLLLDEPLSNLDRKLRDQMRIELANIMRELKITTIYVTHDQEEALVMSDRIAVMDKGKIAQLGAPTEIYENPSGSFVASFIGNSNFFEGRALSTESADCVPVSVKDLTMYGRTLSASIPKEFDDVLVTVRPEKIWMRRPGATQVPSANAFEGSVRNVVYLGETIKYMLGLPGDLQVVVVEKNISGSPIYKPGETVLVGWESKSLIVYPKV